MPKTDGAAFAQNHLQKYGWRKGKGLGRTESGITDAIKPKLKFDTAGVGHNVGEQFSFHWWDHVFNKAAKNIQVEHSHEGVKVKQRVEKTNLISNKRNTQQGKPKSLLYGSFVKHGTMKSDGLISRDEQSSSSSSDDSGDEDCPPESYEGNDERLFKACGGRTAHKGARHGLKQSGKLKRIEEQESSHSNGKISSGLKVRQGTKEETELDYEGQRKKSKKKNKKKEEEERNKLQRRAVSDDRERFITDSNGENCRHEDRLDVETIAEEDKKRKKKKKSKKKKSEQEFYPSKESQLRCKGSDQDVIGDTSNGPLAQGVLNEADGPKEAKRTKKRKQKSSENALNGDGDEGLCNREGMEEYDLGKLLPGKKKKKKKKCKENDIAQDVEIKLIDDKMKDENDDEEWRKRKKLRKEKKMVGLI